MSAQSTPAKEEAASKNTGHGDGMVGVARGAELSVVILVAIKIYF